MHVGTGLIVKMGPRWAQQGCEERFSSVVHLERELARCANKGTHAAGGPLPPPAPAPQRELLAFAEVSCTQGTVRSILWAPALWGVRARLLCPGSEGPQQMKNRAADGFLTSLVLNPPCFP